MIYVLHACILALVVTCTVALIVVVGSGTVLFLRSVFPRGGKP